MYHKGDGVPQDRQRGTMLLQQAAEQGNASAQYNLGGMYDEGDGVPQDKQCSGRNKLSVAARWQTLISLSFRGQTVNCPQIQPQIQQKRREESTKIEKRRTD